MVSLSHPPAEAECNATAKHLRLNNPRKIPGMFLLRWQKKSIGKRLFSYQKWKSNIATDNERRKKEVVL